MTARRVTAGLAVIAALAGFAPAANGAEKQAVPWARISLTKLGFPGISPGFLAAGASALTVNFIDDQHLLVTFGMRGLVRRPPDDPDTDEDREVAAEIVDVPSGKIEARTEWHLHDHGRYLWPIGHGRFMLRVGSSLSTLTPLVNPHTEPFRRMAFPTRGLEVFYVTASPEGGVLTVESRVPRPQAGGAMWADEQRDQGATLLDLYRLTGEGTEASPLTITSPHSVRSPHPFSFPIDQDGFLWATNESRNPTEWTVSFHAFAPAGKKNPVVVGDLHSSCQPRIIIASPSEYIALTCQGVDAHMKMATYGFDGHENWEEPLDLDSSMAFAFAPGSGRFAISRITSTVVQGAGLNGLGLPGDTVFKQEVRVYQTESGDMVLKAATSPPFKTAENFDLSEDGKLAALVQNGEIAIYQLPAPSERDRKASSEVAKYAPPPGGNSELLLAGVVVREQPGETVAGDAPRVATPVGAAAGAPAGGSVQGASHAVASVSGASNPAAADNAAQSTRPVTTASTEATPARKAPTLLLPGEHAEFKDKTPKQTQ
jgi:hypothetical protein